MKPGARVAVGVAIGYLLGRTKKMRLALTLAAAGATGAGTPRTLVQRGLKQLGSTEQLGELTKVARGQLMDAAKTAAVTAASSRIDALNDRLQAKPDLGKLRKDGDADEEQPAEDESRSARGEDEDEEARDTEQEDTDEEDTGQDDAEDEAQDSDEESERPRRKPARRKTARRSTETSDDGESRRGTGRSSSRSTTRSRSGRAPVRRSGR